MLRILSFDTSSHELHLSLLSDREPLLERVVAPSSGERQEVASLLMPEIDGAFKEAGWKKSDAHIVVVGVGPGSFTGIRVAVITARTICQIFQLPLVGISLLECYYASSLRTEPAAVVLSSTSNQFFFGAYESNTERLAHAVVPPASGTREALEAAITDVPFWFGDPKTQAAFSQREVSDLPKLKNIGTIQAQLAFDRLSLCGFATETFAWQNVLPLYLRSPSMTIKKNYAAQDPAHEPR